MIRFEMIIGMWLYRKSNNDGWSWAPEEEDEFSGNKLMSMQCWNKYTRWVCIFTSDQLSSPKWPAISLHFQWIHFETLIIRLYSLSSRHVSSALKFLYLLKSHQQIIKNWIYLNSVDCWVHTDTHWHHCDASHELKRLLSSFSSQNIWIAMIRHSIENYENYTNTRNPDHLTIFTPQMFSMIIRWFIIAREFPIFTILLWHWFSGKY